MKLLTCILLKCQYLKKQVKAEELIQGQGDVTTKCCL